MGSNSSLNTVNWCATVAVAAATAAAICSAYISFAHILLARKTSERNEVKTHENQRVSLKLSHIRLVLCWFDFIAFCFTFVWKRFSATSLFFEFYIQDTFFFLKWSRMQARQHKYTIANSKETNEMEWCVVYGRGANILISTWNLTIHFNESFEWSSTLTHTHTHIHIWLEKFSANSHPYPYIFNAQGLHSFGVV